MTQAPIPSQLDPPAPIAAVHATELLRLEETTIEPASGWPALNLAELWRYRDLIYQLTLRNVRVRYKQTLLGVLWSVLQPVLLMIAFGVMMGSGTTSDGTPYSLFVFTGLIPWIFFQTAVSAASQSVVGSEGLVTKVYFPRLAIPFAAIAAALVDMAIGSVVLAVMLLWHRVPLTWEIALLPVAAALLVLAATGVGSLIAALTVWYRDFRHAIGFLLLIWMFFTPTIYQDAGTGPAAVAAQAAHPTDSAERAYSGSGRWAWIARVNPMTDPVDFFRATVLGRPISWGSLLLSTAANSLLAAIGLLYFRRVEDFFADVI